MLLFYFFPTHTVQRVACCLVLVRVLVAIFFRGAKWCFHSWRRGPSVGTGHDKDFEGGSFLIHRFPWQSFLVFIRCCAVEVVSTLFPWALATGFCVCHLYPSSREWEYSSLHLRKLQELAQRSVCVDLHPDIATFLPKVFLLASADSGMTRGKSPWSGLVSRAVLASYRSWHVLGDSSKAFFLQVQHWFSLVPDGSRYGVNDPREQNITYYFFCGSIDFYAEIWSSSCVLKTEDKLYNWHIWSISFETYHLHLQMDCLLFFLAHSLGSV